MENCLKDLFNGTVTVTPYKSRNSDNDYEYDTSKQYTFSAYIQLSQKKIKDKYGNDIISPCQIYYDSNIDIDLKDKIDFTGNLNTQPDFEIKPHYIAGGIIDHYTIFIK